MLWNFTVYNHSEFLSHRLSGLQKYVLCTYLRFNPDICSFKKEVIPLFIRKNTIFCNFTLSSSLKERWGSWEKGRIERLEIAVGLPTSAAAAAFAKSFMALAKAAAIAAFFSGLYSQWRSAKRGQDFRSEVRASCDLFENSITTAHCNDGTKQCEA